MRIPEDLDPDDPAFPYWADHIAVQRLSRTLWLAAGNPWRPIATAPTEFGVLVCGAGSAMDVAADHGEGWYSSPNDRFDNPIWWCPLPPHPLLLPGLSLPSIQTDKLERQKARASFRAAMRGGSNHE